MYTPPDGDDILFNFTAGYVIPDGDDILFNMGVDDSGRRRFLVGAS